MKTKTLMIATTLAALGLMAGAWFLIDWLTNLNGWWADAAHILGFLAILFVAWFTFPIVTATTAAFFADQADPRSLRLNFEFNLACHDAELCRRLSAEMDAKLANSREITHEMLENAPTLQRIRNGFVRLFIPVL